jgi:small subunit ribosomal protein S16
VAVKIRLLRMGKIRNPQYRIVVADSRTKRDGRAIEYIGIYHPKEHPSVIEVKSDRVQHWLAVGAQPSEPVQRLLEKTGDWQKFKGLPAPPPLLMAEGKVNRQEVYEAEARAAADVVEPTTKQAKKKAEAKAEKAQAPQETPKVTEGSVTDEPRAVAEDAAAPKADAPVAPKVEAADTREEAAAKAEDPAGAGADNAS